MLAALGLSLLVASSPSSYFDDIYEENDTCAEAAPLTVPPNGQLTSFYFVTSGPASAGGADEDWFSIDVPAGHRLRVDSLGTFPGNPGVEVYIRSGVACGTVEASGFVAGPTLEAANPTAATVQYFVQFLPVSPALVQEGMTMSVTVTPDYCNLSIGPDVFEPNETPGTAPVLPLGLHRDLTITSSSDVDYYLVNVPRGDALSARFSSLNLFGARAICSVFDPGALVNSFLGSLTPNGLTVITNTTSGDWLLLLVTLDSGGFVSPCEEYALFLDTVATSCSGIVPDSLEGTGNNVRSHAVLLTRGTYENLNVVQYDQDWYAFDVPPGFGLHVTVEVQPGAGGVTGLFYDEPGLNWYAIASNETERSVFRYGNPGATTRRIDLGILYGVGAGGQGCTYYGLVVELLPQVTMGQICVGGASPSGSPTRIELFGSDRVADGNLWLVATELTSILTDATLFLGFPDPTPPAVPGAFCLVSPVSRWGRFVFAGDDRDDRAVDVAAAGPLVGSTLAIQLALRSSQSNRLSGASTFVLR